MEKVDGSYDSAGRSVSGPPLTANETLSQPRLAICPSHGADDCSCQVLSEDLNVPGAITDPLIHLEEPDYSKFENVPCDYCRSRRLICYLQRGEPYCTPCATLFRECSLVKSNTLEATNYIGRATGTFLDTLHIVDEDTCKEQGSFTGIKPLLSKSRGSGTATPVAPDDEPGSSKRIGVRFPRPAVKLLRDWMDSHADNPYPSKEQKAELERKTGLTPSQIADWLANTRRRRKVTEKAKPKVCMSPSLAASTPAIPIPGATEKAGKPWDELGPFERWKHSPPEHEPASMNDIADAVARSELPEDDDASLSPVSRDRQRKGSSNGSRVSNVRAPSTTSQETGQTSSLSASSATFSHHSSNSTHGSFGSFSSSLAGKRDRPRRRRAAVTAPGRKTSETWKRIFQCTFCTDTFKSKYDWTRHEKSVHLSQEKWVCAPHGPVITDPESGSRICVYCEVHNPSEDHLWTHNHQTCVDKGLDSRTFFRKDHLRQHMRLVHGCEMKPSMDQWKSTEVNIHSRCGFCGQRFTTWQDRVDHLTAHFRAGALMSEWKGCRGFHPAVAAQVTNAMPPYLIGMESVSPNPFSATDPATWRQLDWPVREETGADKTKGATSRPQTGTQVPTTSPTSRTTCYEILAVGLGKYAKETADQGIVITDEMLQTQARRIMFDSDDSWNQTAADNPEWLDLFKKAVGLEFIPNTIGGQGLQIPEDLETYGDLGLRIPFALQLQALSQRQFENSASPEATGTGSDQQATAKRTTSALESSNWMLQEGAMCACDEDDSHVHQFIANLAGSVQHPQTTRSDSEPLMQASNGQAPALDVDSIVRPIQRQDNFLHGLQSVWNADAPMSEPPNYEQTVMYSTLPVDATAKGAAVSTARRARTPRHRLELSPDQARNFATVTGPWPDSGVMPPAVSTDRLDGTTTTGAMMEFLGGDLGRSLPFRDDAFVSILHTTDAAGMAQPEEAMLNAEELDQQIDDLIRASTWPEEPSLYASAHALASATAQPPGDVAMADVNLDDITFDDIFDMPIDQDFDPQEATF